MKFVLAIYNTTTTQLEAWGLLIEKSPNGSTDQLR